MKVTISTNHWRLPAPPVHLDGVPSPERRAREEADARAMRARWKPGPEAYALLDQLKSASGHTVLLQGWDPIMLMLDDEGPFPIRAHCVDVIVRNDSEMHPQAYVVLQAVETLKVPGDYDGRSLLIPDGDHLLFPVHQLYELEIVCEVPPAP